MLMNNKFPDRKTLRYKHFDYNDGIVFITICTKNRKQILSKTVGTDVPGGPHVELTHYGKIVNKYINQLNDFYEHVEVPYYVIMPNHIHLLLFIKATDRRGRRSLQDNVTTSPSASVEKDPKASATSKFISTLKRFCNKEIGVNIFQRSYFDHIIRSDDDLDMHIDYILRNPENWFYDELYSNE